MGLSSKDFVQTAVLKAINGERRYDLGKSLFHNLCQIISSEVSNVVQSYENRHVEHADDATVVDIRDYRDSPEEEVVHKQAARHLFAYLEQRDAAAKQVAEQIILYERAGSLELSVELKRTVSDIENIKKRLRRLCIKYRQEHEPASAPASLSSGSSSGLC
jgi:hypothetical protein